MGAPAIGVYQNILYSGLGVAEVAIDGESLSGVMPHSNDNAAINLVNNPSLSVAYPGSTTNSFALESVYYGCTTQLENGVVEDAVACKITFTGYKAGSATPVVTQTFTFTPAQPVDVQNAPTFGTFSSGFQGLQYANITFEPELLTDFQLDNLVGTTTS